MFVQGQNDKTIKDLYKTSTKDEVQLSTNNNTPVVLFMPFPIKFQCMSTTKAAVVHLQMLPATDSDYIHVIISSSTCVSSHEKWRPSGRRCINI